MLYENLQLSFTRHIMRMGWFENIKIRKITAVKGRGRPRKMNKDSLTLWHDLKKKQNKRSQT